MALSIEPTTSCNLRCPECPSGLRSFTRDKGNLEKSLFEDCIDQLSETLISLNFYFQGEPFLNPQFLEMVSYAKSKNIYTISSSNGHFLKDDTCKKIISSGLDQLIISIDGVEQKTYESYRIGGDLEKVLKGTRNLVSWKKKLKSSSPKIVFQFLVVKPNEHEIPAIKKLSKELGVDELKLKTAQIYDFKNGNPLIPSLEKYSRYHKNLDGTYRIKNKLSNQCWKMWHSSVITWNGLVLPCCFDKDAQHRLGNINLNQFKEIWNSTEYNTMRLALLNHRKEIDICKNCTEGCQVWA